VRKDARGRNGSRRRRPPNPQSDCKVKRVATGTQGSDRTAKPPCGGSTPPGALTGSRSRARFGAGRSRSTALALRLAPLDRLLSTVRDRSSVRGSPVVINGYRRAVLGVHQPSRWRPCGQGSLTDPESGSVAPASPASAPFTNPEGGAGRGASLRWTNASGRGWGQHARIDRCATSGAGNEVLAGNGVEGVRQIRRARTCLAFAQVRDRATLTGLLKDQRSPL